MEEKFIIYDTDDMEKPQAQWKMEEIRQKAYETNNDTQVTIVVTAFNRLEKTKECVSSLMEYTTDIKFQLYLVDNGSEPEIMDYFKSIEHENKVLVRVTKNITGVYAFNRFVYNIVTPFVVLIPNDVIVTRNWLKNLLICAQSDNQIGMVVPVSTNISNQQLEMLGGFSDLEEMQNKAADFNVSDWKKWEERIRLIPSLVLFRREVFDVVGTFDVGFIHDFGDDDFSFRIRRAGYKLILCGDTFVHHNHYMQERKMDSEELQVASRGREDFQRKYAGIDAWGDCVNHVLKFKNYGDIGVAKYSEVKILGVDVRCGTPILDLKNQLRLNGYRNFIINAYTTDPKYYVDLGSISQKVDCDHISNLVSHFRDQKFDMVVLGEAINFYDQSEERLLDLLSLLEKNGVLVFKLHNCNNIYEYLWQQGFLSDREKEFYRDLSYEEILNSVKEVALKKVDIQFSICPIQDEIQEFVNNTAFPSMNEGRIEKIQNLYVKDYWFWIQKA